MRPWFIAPLLGVILTLSCSTLVAEPARVDPPRSLPLQIDFSNSYNNDILRVTETVWLEPYIVDAQGGLAGIRTKLDEVGPKSEAAGRRFDGVTTWDCAGASISTLAKPPAASATRRSNWRRLSRCRNCPAKTC